MEVEKLIVDYLTYEATAAVFNEYASSHASANNVESAIDNAECMSYNSILTFYVLLDCLMRAMRSRPALRNYTNMHNIAWSSIFRQHFPAEKLDSKASFRAKLLHLTVLTSQRTMPDIVDSDITVALEALRTSHGKRRSHFTQSKSSTCPLSRSQLAQLPIGVEYRAHHIEVLRDNGSTHVDPPLARLLPLLCKLAAYRGAMDTNSTTIIRDWMNCVGQLMLQAAIEMLLVHGIAEADVLREIFSWSWKADNNVDEMHPHQHEREVSEWEKIKAGWAGLVSLQSEIFVSAIINICSALASIKIYTTCTSPSSSCSIIPTPYV
jgi:hypothetical protein